MNRACDVLFFDDSATQLELYGRAPDSDAWWPLHTLPLAALLLPGQAAGQFALKVRCQGQLCQLNRMPSACGCATPQLSNPEQDTGFLTGGSPVRITATDSVTVTDLLTTAQCIGRLETDIKNSAGGGQ